MTVEDKYKLVIDEYFANGFNRVAAYMKFYSECTYESAKIGFVRMLTNVTVQEYMDYKHNEVKKALEITHIQLVETLRTWIESDMTETMLLTAQEIKQLPIEVRRLITEFDRTTKRFGSDDAPIIEEKIKLKFVSKEKAAEMLAKHIGFYEKDNTQKGDSMGRAIRSWVGNDEDDSNGEEE